MRSQPRQGSNFTRLTTFMFVVGRRILRSANYHLHRIAEQRQHGPLRRRGDGQKGTSIEFYRQQAPLNASTFATKQSMIHANIMLKSVRNRAIGLRVSLSTMSVLLMPLLCQAIPVFGLINLGEWLIMIWLLLGHPEFMRENTCYHPMMCHRCRSDDDEYPNARRRAECIVSWFLFFSLFNVL
jgi:hypothetical protein